MAVEVLSFGLAIAVGLVCWALIKYTADEFERSYGQLQTQTSVQHTGYLKSAVGAISLLAAALIAFVR